MPPKRKIFNAKVLREHGAETQLRPLIQNSFRSILRQRSADTELESYRSRSYSNLTMNKNHQLNSTEFSRPRLISPDNIYRQRNKQNSEPNQQKKVDTIIAVMNPIVNPITMMIMKLTNQVMTLPIRPPS
jgi:hypothetical protein